jgi:hypothetical protein
MGSSWLKVVERGFQHLRVQTPRVERVPGFRAGEPDLRGTEEQRIDLVEVAAVALEDF